MKTNIGYWQVMIQDFSDVLDLIYSKEFLTRQSAKKFYDKTFLEDKNCFSFLGKRIKIEKKKFMN